MPRGQRPSDETNRPPRLPAGALAKEGGGLPPAGKLFRGRLRCVRRQYLLVGFQCGEATFVAFATLGDAIDLGADSPFHIKHVFLESTESVFDG